MAATQSQILDALLNYRLDYIGDRWNFLLAVGSTESAPGGIGQGMALTFSFPTTLPTYDAGLTGFAALTTEQAQTARQVFAHYASLTQLTFTETAQLGTKNIAIIQHTITTPGVAGYANSPGLGYSFDGSGTILSVSEVSSQQPGNFSSGDVYIDAGYAAGEYAPGGEGYLLLLHEIGHSMGLQHPFEGTAPLGAAENHKGFTVMAYNEAPHSLRVTVTGTQNGYSISFENVQPRSLMLGDILALQHTYGTNTATNSGNTTYQWQTSEKFLETIWDGGGTDTIDASNQVLASSINLTAGSFSSIGLRQTFTELYADIPEFARPTVGDTLMANGLNDLYLYSGRDNLAIAFGANIENAVGGSGADTLMGNVLANVLDGGAGNDTLDGAEGADSLTGGVGFDWLNGGHGNDLLRGADNADTLYGDDGDDSLAGGKGTDYVDGGDGNDTLSGGVGADTLEGRYGIDRVDYSLATDGVTVNLTIVGVAQLISTGQSSDTLSGLEHITGSNFPDALTGDAGANSLLGLLGNDTLIGNEGFDTLDGGDGNDLLAGGNNADSLLGGIGNDTLGGGKGVDTMDGGDGDDILTGVLGPDQLTGGSGADRFVFNALLDPMTNVDTITDFTSGVDVIHLSAAIFGAFAGQVGQTVGTSANLAYSSGSGVLSYDADGAGGGSPVAFAILGSSLHPATLGTDFFIIA